MFFLKIFDLSSYSRLAKLSTHFETLDLISRQPCGFVDFIKVNSRVSVSHGVCPCVLSFCWELRGYVEWDRENRYEMTGHPPASGPGQTQGSGPDTARPCVIVIVTATYHLLHFPDEIQMMLEIVCHQNGRSSCSWPRNTTIIPLLSSKQSKGRKEKALFLHSPPPTSYNPDSVSLSGSLPRQTAIL